MNNIQVGVKAFIKNEDGKYLLLKRNITLKKAGFSKVLDQMMINLLSNLDEIISFQNNVYEFISNQRINFMKYIKNNFSEFFDFDKSSRVEERE